VDGKEEGSFEHFKENGKFEKRETWKNGKVIFKK
jgi:antitoxin component YwqK of YwqJK toxin-antitoxin module